MLPNFVGLGVQRAGTTWIHQCLSEHPQVFLPAAKELHFFDRDFDKGLDWYAAQFAPATVGDSRKIAGEITPNYLVHPHAADRLAQALPGVRCFVVLREPVSRAFSAYQLFRDRYGDWDFPQACREGQDLVQGGLYADGLARLYNSLPRERVRVLLYDQLQADPLGFLRELYRFLQIDTDFVPESLGRRVNRVVYPRLQARLKKWHLGWSIDMLRGTALGEWIKRRHVQTAGPAQESVTPAQRHELAELFHDDIVKTQQLTGLDLSAWR